MTEVIVRHMVSLKKRPGDRPGPDVHTPARRRLPPILNTILRCVTRTGRDGYFFACTTMATGFISSARGGSWMSLPQ